jgi:hypothetical protein
MLFELLGAWVRVGRALVAYERALFPGAEICRDGARGGDPTRSNAEGCRDMGRERKRPLRSDWESVKDDVMRRAVRCKFARHDGIRAILLRTGDDEIVENAPSDYYWGCGADGSGRNMLGQILMEVRAELRQQMARPGA